MREHNTQHGPGAGSDNDGKNNVPPNYILTAIGVIGFVVETALFLEIWSQNSYAFWMMYIVLPMYNLSLSFLVWACLVRWRKWKNPKAFFVAIVAGVVFAFALSCGYLSNGSNDAMPFFPIAMRARYVFCLLISLFALISWGWAKFLYPNAPSTPVTISASPTPPDQLAASDVTPPRESPPVVNGGTPPLTITKPTTQQSRRLPKILLTRPQIGIDIGSEDGIGRTVLTINSEGNGSLAFPAPGPNCLFTLKVKDNVLGIDAQISDGPNAAHLYVASGNGGDVTVDRLPYDWDVNGDDKAIEVVDGNHVPVFQIEYVNSVFIRIRGVFPISNDFVTIMTGQSSFDVRKKDQVQYITNVRQTCFRQVFQYPSSLRNPNGPSYDGVRLPVSLSASSQPVPSPASTSQTTVPGIALKYTEVRIHGGSFYQAVPLTRDGNGAAPYFVGSAFKIEIKNFVIGVSGTITDGPHRCKISTLSDGTFTLENKPTSWDVNRNDLMIEVFDVRGFCIFQMICPDGANVWIKGAFLGADSNIELVQGGSIVGVAETALWSGTAIIPFLKHPASKYPRRYVDVASGPPVTDDFIRDMFAKMDASNTEMGITVTTNPADTKPPP